MFRMNRMCTSKHKNQFFIYKKICQRVMIKSNRSSKKYIKRNPNLENKE